jgi:hypothetical protein
MIQSGLYECVSEVYIRREPRIVDNLLGHNRVGKLTPGTQRRIYDVVTNKDNSTWGRISEADAAGISQWVCIQGLNRTYMKLVEGSEPSSDRLSRLEEWARTKGYKG